MLLGFKCTVPFFLGCTVLFSMSRHQGDYVSPEDGSVWAVIDVSEARVVPTTGVITIADTIHLTVDGVKDVYDLPIEITHRFAPQNLCIFRRLVVLPTCQWAYPLGHRYGTTG